MRSSLWPAALCAAILLCSGCAGEAVPPSKSKEIGGDLAGCLSGYEAKISAYFDGRSNAETVTALFDCYATALDKFMTRVEGSESGRYEAKELKLFLERYFMKGEILDSGFYYKSLQLKVALLGGTDLVLTRYELQRTIELVQTLKEQALRLLPHMPLSLEKFGRSGGGDAFAAGDALTQAGDAFAKVIGKSATQYTFKQMDELFAALQEAFPENGMSKSLQEIRQQLPFWQKLKGTLIGMPADVIDASDWQETLAVGFRWFSAYLRIRSLMEREEYTLAGRTLDHWMIAGNDVVALLRRSLYAKDKQTLRFTEIDELVDSLEKYTHWKLPLKRRTFKNSLRPLIRKWMGGFEEGPEGRGADGLTMAHLNRFWDGTLRWERQQRRLDRAFVRLGSRDSARTGEYSKEQLREAIATIASGEKSPELNDLYRLIGFNGFFVGEEWSIDFSDTLTTRGHSFQNLSILNGVWQLFRWMIAGYAQEKERSDEANAVRLKEWIQLYDDFREFGIETKLFDPRPFGDSALSRFREANLFTFHSNGDMFLSIEEGVEQIAQMISGKRLSSRLHERAVDACRDSLGMYPGPLGEQQVRAYCYRKHLYSNVDDYWQNLPLLLAYYKSLKGAERKTFEVNLETAALRFGLTPENGLINAIDSDGFALITHYVETLFARFDQHRSPSGLMGTIGLKDAEMAYPMFENTLVAMSSKTDPQFLLSLLTYLLAHGKPPETTWEKLKFKYNWLNDPEEWVFEADRSRVLGLFGIIKRPSSSD